MQYIMDKSPAPQINDDSAPQSPTPSINSPTANSSISHQLDDGSTLLTTNIPRSVPSAPSAASPETRQRRLSASPDVSRQGADLTARLESARKMAPAAGQFMLPEAALRPARPVDVDQEANNRLSLSSLYSLGSAIVQGVGRGFAGSGPSSVAGSEPENSMRKLQHDSTASVTCICTTYFTILE